MTNSLTRRQEAVLSFIRSEIKDKGFAPTVREICRQFGIRSPHGVTCHLRALESKGYIARDELTPRGLRLTDPTKRPPRVPIVGRVSAGSLLEAIEFSETPPLLEMLAAQGATISVRLVERLGRNGRRAALGWTLGRLQLVDDSHEPV